MASAGEDAVEERRTRRFLGRFGIGCGVLALLLGGAYLYLEWAFGAFQRIPPIMRELPPHASVAESRDAFDQSVHRHFPVGSAEQAMVRELTSEGFTRYEVSDGRHGLAWENQTPCGLDLSVVWRADEHGRITEITGGGSVTCF